MLTIPSKRLYPSVNDVLDATVTSSQSSSTILLPPPLEDDDDSIASFSTERIQNVMIADEQDEITAMQNAERGEHPTNTKTATTINASTTTSTMQPVECYIVEPPKKTQGDERYCSSANASAAAAGGAPPPPTTETVSRSSSPKNHCVSLGQKHCSTYLIGMILLGGLIIAIIALVHFMKSNEIQFQNNNSANSQTGGGGTTGGITMAELAIHNTPQDCWVAYHGNVYDMTQFAKRHPGGANWIYLVAGTDGTSDFEQYHTQSLLRTVENYKLGVLSLATQEENGSLGTTNTASESSSVGGSNGSSGGTSNTSGSSTTTTTTSGITLTELATHNTPEDCWVAFHGNVYDMTQYAKLHPGGQNWIYNVAGTDGTSEFDRFHSQAKLQLVEKYKVGSLATNNNNSGSSSSSSSSSTTTAGGGGSSYYSGGYTDSEDDEGEHDD